MTSSTSRSEPGEPRGRSLAVIDTPAAPPGWEDARADLVRIVDPLGRAVAWLAPSHGGRCVGLAVRPSDERGTAWLHLFDSADPEALLDGSADAGCRVVCALVAPESGEPIELGRTWRFVERDPTAATLEASVRANVPAALRDSIDGLVLRFTAALSQGSLRFDLRIENFGTSEITLRLGLNLELVAEHMRGATGSIEAQLPEIARVGGTRVPVPPRSVATLGTTDSPVAVEVEFVGGHSRLDTSMSRDAETVSLFAFAGDEPDAPVTVGAGETYDLALTITARPSQRQAG